MYGVLNSDWKGIDARKASVKDGVGEVCEAI